MAFAPAEKLEVPGTVKAPVWLMAPLEMRVKLLPMLDAAKAVAMLLVKVTLFAPLLESVMAPVKLLLLPFVVKSMAFVPAVKLAVPGIVKAPVWLMAPLETRVKLLPMLDAAREVARLFVRVIAFAPLLESVMAPVKLLLLPFVVKLMALAPAVKLAVPGTVKAPVWLITPPAVATKFPLFVKVKAGKVIAALLKVTVKLCKLVREAKFVGNAALALILRNPMSRKLPNVPAKVMAVDPKLLA